MIIIATMNIATIVYPGSRTGALTTCDSAAPLGGPVAPISGLVNDKANTRNTNIHNTTTTNNNSNNNNDNSNSNMLRPISVLALVPRFWISEGLTQA